MLSREAYEHMKRPHGVSPLPMVDFQGIAGTEGQGPFYILFIQVLEEKIEGASFRTYCCPWANAIGSALTKLISGKALAEASQVSADQISSELGGVPRDKRYLVPLAVAALQNTMKNIEVLRKS